MDLDEIEACIDIHSGEPLHQETRWLVGEVRRLLAVIAELSKENRRLQESVDYYTTPKGPWRWQSEV